jgi:NAD(P)-dependent dehydrogenase (short-subunit alcohol dehydrogenase family)
VSSPLDGKTCVVTGAGRGIGKTVATDLAAQGADLVLCSRTQSQIEETARAIRDAHDVSVRAVALDVRDVDAVAELARTCEERGPVLGLVNCAGVLGPVGRIDTIDVGEWMDALAINVGGTAAVCAAFAGGMIAAGEGSIVNFSGGGIGGPGLPGCLSAYTSSKAAVVALSESLALELSPSVRVNVVAPGAIATTFMRQVLDCGPDIAGPDLYARTVAQQANPAPTEPLLRLVRYLLSPESAQITGRFLSARWDDPAAIDTEKLSPSRFTLRRIDGVLFAEVDGGGGAP